MACIVRMQDGRRWEEGRMRCCYSMMRLVRGVSFLAIVLLVVGSE